ncbi:MAG: ribonuclease H-like domain-containing protein [Planctomycetes bacterium]|nr:ribonuclease H-like domain-containing protein [Planctomycetota bacterium]
MTRPSDDVRPASASGDAAKGELFAKLKRLRRDVDPPREPARPALPAWFARRLAREHESAQANPTRGDPRTDAARRGSGADSGAAALAAKTSGAPRDLEPCVNAFGTHAVRVRRLPDATRHGEWRLADLLSADMAELAWLALDDTLVSLAPSRALFLDIETTGLSGGAGTHVYMVGLARFDGGALEVWQGFARGPEEEPALLASTAERILASSFLVTFFGKSFDRHRLADKMRVHGIAPPFDARPHLDLYHPLRRLYGKAYPDGRLATLERELCGVARDADLPGSFAPAAWFDFLADRPHRLEAVFRHNFDDVQSLVVLCAHLARTRSGSTHDGAVLSGAIGARCAGLARLAARRRDWDDALRWLAAASGDLRLPDDLEELAVELRARLAKRAATQRRRTTRPLS